MKSENLIWLANCLDETSEESTMKEIGKFWQIPAIPDELADMNFINLPNSQICRKWKYTLLIFSKKQKIHWITK